MKHSPRSTANSPAICVYCGAKNTVDPRHLAAARDVGKRLVDAGFRLVFGGGNCGMMGEVSNAVLAAGGHVTGVFPKHLDQFEVRHREVSELVLVENMHERKQTMFDLSDAFVILPGGFGTMDEMFEILTWRQIGLHEKPLVIFNHLDYWNPLLTLMDHLMSEGFASSKNRGFYEVVDSSDSLIHSLSEGVFKKNNIS